MNTSTGKVVHSTGYGTVQNPRGIGTASTQSFRERIAVDEQRSFVGRYKDARVMRESRNTLSQAKAYEGGGSGADAKTSGTGVRALDGAAERAKMAARFEPKQPISGGTPPPRRNSGI